MQDLTFKELREANARRGIEWMGEPNGLDDLSFTAIELGGEAGEALDAVKKLLRHLKGVKGGVPMQQSLIDIGDELADVIISADRVAESLGIDLGLSVIRKFNKTSTKQGLSTTLQSATGREV